MVELENLDVAFTTIRAASLVTQNNMNFHPLRDVAVVTNADAGGLFTRRALLSRFKRAPREVVLLLQPQHGTVHVLHKTVDARVGEFPPPLFLGVVARLRLRALRSNIIGRC